MHTAGLRGESLAKFSLAERASWLRDLHAGAEAAGLVATELRKAAEILLAQADQGAAIEEWIVKK
jgi:hypothetical protein